jgi:hypothetical protein
MVTRSTYFGWRGAYANPMLCRGEVVDGTLHVRILSWGAAEAPAEAAGELN